PDLRAAAFTGPLPNRCAQGSEGDRHLHCIAAPNICRQMAAPGDTRALGESTRQCVVVGNRRRLTHLHEATGTVTAARQPEIGRDLQPQTITEPGPVQSGFALFSGFSLMCGASVLCHGGGLSGGGPVETSFAAAPHVAAKNCNNCKILGSRRSRYLPDID